MEVNPPLISFPLMQIDCDKTLMVTLKHDDKLPDGAECAFQVQLFLLIYLRGYVFWFRIYILGTFYWMAK